MENWRPIGNSDVYEVSDQGRVKSKNYLGHGYERILRLNPDHKGYLRVRIYLNGVRKTCKVHRLVAEAFLPNPANLPQVNHLDGDKRNNDVGNLEWTTARDNVAHAYRNGLKENNRLFAQKLGSTVGKAALRKAMEKHFVPVTATNIATGETLSFDSIKEAAETLGLRQSNIGANVRGRAKSCGGYVFARRG